MSPRIHAGDDRHHDDHPHDDDTHAAAEDHDDMGGLRRDLPALIAGDAAPVGLRTFGRRAALRWIGGASAVGLLAACAGNGGSTADVTAPSDTATGSDNATGSAPTAAGADPTTTTTTAAPTATATDPAASAGAEIPDETAGPYPADGSNGPNLLGVEGIVRPDLTTSIGDLTGTADGIPTTIQLTVVDASTGDPLPTAAVYLWHCTAGGQYSIYEIADQNYLRGVQVADGAGRVEFTTIFPGCYRGRWPHCHFEVYDGIGAATAGNLAIKTSQLALPQANCEQVYVDGRYGNSLSNLGSLSLSTDNVFRDGWTEQLAAVAGSNDSGFTVSLVVRV